MADFISKKLFGETFSELRRMSKRQLLQQGVQLGEGFFSPVFRQRVVCFIAQTYTISSYVSKYNSFIEPIPPALPSFLSLPPPGMVVCSALMIWRFLMLCTMSESPVVVVLSGSMEPGFRRGDILFLDNRPQHAVRPGDIVVFSIDGRSIPIVHRAIKVHERREDPTQINVLTKVRNYA